MNIKTTLLLTVCCLMSAVYGLYWYSDDSADQHTSTDQSSVQRDMVRQTGVTRTPAGRAATAEETAQPETVETAPIVQSRHAGHKENAGTGSSAGTNPFEALNDDLVVTATAPQLTAKGELWQAGQRRQSTFAEHYFEPPAATAPQGKRTPDDPTVTANVEFTFTPLPGIRYLPVPTVIGPDVQVYAHILPTQDCSICQVLWQHQESGQVELETLEKLTANRHLTVHITPEQGWSRGTYSLSVYRKGKPSQLIGQSSMLVSGLDSQPTEISPHSEYIQSLLDNGQAVKKF